MRLQHGDLAWFYGGDMEAALGLRSNFGALVDLALSGIGEGGSGARGVSAHRLDAVSRARAIAARIARVEPQHQRILVALHTPVAGLAREVRQEFAELAGVALLQLPPKRKGAKSALLSLCVVGPAAERVALQESSRELAKKALAAFRATDEADAPPVSRRRRSRQQDDDVEPIIPRAAWT